MEEKTAGLGTGITYLLSVSRVVRSSIQLKLIKETRRLLLPADILPVKA